MKKLVVVFLMGTMLGCIHKPSGPVTAWERVTTENAVFAQTLDTTTQGVIAAQTSMLITTAQAKPILEFTSQVATIQQQINRILAQAPSSASIPVLQSLVAQINTSAQTLVTNGALGIKNPKSQQNIGADIQAIVNSAQVIMTSYAAATGGR